jgi:hypothetical protein
MANMSYCRWENTGSDFDDCLEAIREMNEDLDTFKKLSASEKRAMTNLRADVEEFMELFDSIEDALKSPEELDDDADADEEEDEEVDLG